MAQIVVGVEQERPNAWSFEVFARDETAERTIELRLHWADYERWSQGRHAPARVAAAAIRVAVDALTLDELPAKADAAALARRLPGFSERVDGLLDDPTFQPGITPEP